MAKITCSNCGHKVKSTDMICGECGNYLGEGTVSGNTRSTPQEPVTQETVIQKEEVSEAEPVRTAPNVAAGDTINIQTKGSLYRFFPMIIYAVFLGVYIVSIEFLAISPYYFLPVLLLMFIAPQIARRIFFPVKFNPNGFNVPHNGNYLQFHYNEISNAVVRIPQRGIQMVTLSMDKSESNVTLDFDQMFSLRQFLSQLNRRRIPISVENAAARS
ncbi:hypothetical protein IX51_01765 [uncultured archaeon]|nr:hypothetical protein IX51_01765 [uncultured archaeon]HKJ96712.1 zinc ribbon domain-containing protein [Thermoplasmataceae archaeon]